MSGMKFELVAGGIATGFLVWLFVALSPVWFKTKGEATMGWKNPDLEDFGKGDLFILAEDGDKGVVVPLGEPEIIRDSFKGNTRKQAEVPVYDLKEDCIRFWRLGSRNWRKFTRVNPGGENDRKIVVTVVRHGEANNQDTTYDIQRTGDVEPDTELYSAVEKAFLALPNERAKRDK